MAGKKSNAGELASVRSGTSSILPLTFFERPAVRVARDLLGKKIVRVPRWSAHSFDHR